MRALPWLFVGVAGCCLLPPRTWRATPAQLAPLAPLDTHVRSEIGPLALAPRPPETPWPRQQEAWRITKNRYLDRARIHAETVTFRAFLDELYQPRTPASRTAFERAHDGLARLEQLDPYPIEAVTSAINGYAHPLHICVQNTGITAPCDREVRQRAARAPVFEVREAAPGIVTLAVRDLRDADDPAWRDFPAATPELAAARGLVLDLRDAVGSDPRPLLPLLRDLTGRAQLAPLRAIERPASAEPYAQAYRARYTDRGRDPDVWRALLGPGDRAPSAPATTPPIAILVGRHCQSACELVARVLEAYAGAVVIGGVLQRSGRLARDEPAMFVLPHSHTSVYFHATRYVLAADIEAATGPTEGWRAHTRDDLEPPRKGPGLQMFDYLDWAVRDVEQRIADPSGWPRCDALAPRERGRARADAVETTRACATTYRIEIVSQVPASALQRFLGTCAIPLAFWYSFNGRFAVRAATRPPARVLAQIAASELVHSVTLRCEDADRLP